MKSCDTKRMLFEMMEKMNPDFKQINELAPVPTSLPPQSSAPTQQQPRMASDVKAVDRANKTATTVQTANKRINTATEFPQAFKLWFESLGYTPQNPAISTSRVLTEIRKAMQEMGYK